MKKLIFALSLCLLVVACSNAKKPPLSETQIVNGKSIIIPPDFDVLPTVEPKKNKKEK